MKWWVGSRHRSSMVAVTGHSCGWALVLSGRRGGSSRSGGWALVTVRLGACVLVLLGARVLMWLGPRVAGVVTFVGGHGGGCRRSRQRRRRGLTKEGHVTRCDLTRCDLGVVFKQGAPLRELVPDARKGWNLFCEAEKGPVHRLESEESFSISIDKTTAALHDFLSSHSCQLKNLLTILLEICLIGYGRRSSKFNFTGVDRFIEFWNNHKIIAQPDKTNMSGATPRHTFTVPASSEP
ncbi:uncharacterized protein LACBIDRAFT_332969 [Laccaria bicolor S238N-H82]|uniref:Predicted protein n=1 Tax=Laccaria bicolor (strain S238N-H82 / ATCC MYA-4686) TaxID=486041 RepID=B0DUF2_LACBS|nr:uncharacterized protein LACBIDRAFT_332969 [Laccaria bicolor S238N-H82]EDR01731.1 predicted protein [Laccaria bicolor S238N-H82]|eukprot:XP_001887544.1 predicted protein [Laccaria bicolor S238N-H82]